jgi:hypothetical protein
MSNVPMTRPEQALAIHEQRYGHSVTFAGLDGGRILLLGAGEFRTSSDGGLSWDSPYRGTEAGGEPVESSCACLVELSGGALGLATRRTRPGQPNRYESEMVFRTSEDEGRTWSEPVVTNAGRLRAHAGFPASTALGCAAPPKRSHKSRLTSSDGVIARPDEAEAISASARHMYVAVVSDCFVALAPRNDRGGGDLLAMPRLCWSEKP